MGFLQAYSAGVEQDQHRNRLDVPRGAKKARQLGAVNLAESTAHKPALLGGEEHRRTCNPAASDDDAIVELRWKIEHLQVRADFALFRADEFLKAASIEQQSNPLARRCLVPARGTAAPHILHIR